MLPEISSQSELEEITSSVPVASKEYKPEYETESAVSRLHSFYSTVQVCTTYHQAMQSE